MIGAARPRARAKLQLVALKHRPREVGALSLHSPHFDPHQAHMLEVDAAFDVTNINGLETNGSNKLHDGTFGARVISAEHHRGLKGAVVGVDSVPEIFVAVNVKAAHHVGRWKKFLNNFTAALAAAAVGETRPNWIGAINNNFSVQVKPLDAIGNSGVRAANEHYASSLDRFHHVHCGEAGSLGERCLGFFGARIASRKDDLLAQLEELRGKSAADAAEKFGVRLRVWIGLIFLVHLPS
jgi:hypothetical protein